MIPAIDAHHHFWTYSAAEYPWMGEGMEGLRRDFGPADLAAEARAAGVTGAMSVQARQSLAETHGLLALASRHSSLILGVVGWAPLIHPQIDAILEPLAADPRLKGIRHVLQDEADDRYMLRPDFQRGVAAVGRHGLVYDILIYERHLPYATELVDAHPDVSFVLDHIAKPRIRDGAIEPWRSRMRELARRPNVACKLSGMATEAGWTTWTGPHLRPYFEVVLECFGPARLLFGSDWPVLTLAGSYGQWTALVREWIAALSADEQRQILRTTAQAVYRLPEDGS